MVRVNRNGFDERSTKIMMNKPITELSRLIGAKWFLPLERLAKEAGIGIETCQKALYGKEILPRYEKKLRAFLDRL